MKFFISLIVFLCFTFSSNAAQSHKLPSGVEYTVIHSGTGQRPKPNSLVTLHYRGTLAGGKEFFNSHNRKYPASFALDTVIPCWSETLKRIKAGSVVQIVCPPATAYGKAGIKDAVPPNAVVFFELELLSID